MNYAVNMASYGKVDVHIFVKISRGVQARLWLCFSNLRVCCTGITERETSMQYATEIGPECVAYVPDFITISLGLLRILRSLPQKFWRLLCWYYWCEGFIKNLEMTLGGMIHAPCFRTIYAGVQAVLRLCLSFLWYCNTGISIEKGLCSAPSRCGQWPWDSNRV
jgi:hypothetical protein